MRNAEPDRCPIEELKSKLEVVQTACCDTGACSHSVMPSSCDFDCAKALPIFMTHRDKLIEELLTTNEYYGLKQLEARYHSPLCLFTFLSPHPRAVALLVHRILHFQ